MKRGSAMFQRLFVIAIGTIYGGSPLAAQEESPLRPSKVDLSAGTFAKLHALIRPQENEWRHLRVDWLTDVVAARKRAAAEDKPIVICYTGGAGYNEPLGVC